MHPDRFTYPPCDEPLLGAYDGRFESVFVVLHPFVRMPEQYARRQPRQYPADGLILAEGAKCSWAKVIAETGLGNCAHLNQALLTSTGALADHLCDPDACGRLVRFLQTGPVWMPGEGEFEPLLRDDFLAAFEAAGAGELVFVPEFPGIDPIRRISVAALSDRSQDFPARGSLLAPDASFLFTVDWDSFFTLFYGPRAFVAGVARARNLEGFFAAPTTEHAWFNYSMGCATVTLSPEHWSTA